LYKRHSYCESKQQLIGSHFTLEKPLGRERYKFVVKDGRVNKTFKKGTRDDILEHSALTLGFSDKKAIIQEL